ncbi:hypothetical protein [Lentzea nigeriaca]|uniref:hypothetical protein n=1 Tax=Lentzea nigeriaca TaxID=1128665 RepID=UPI001956FA93|nr:hypothetical protein [Lentzea nigeriaca]MBM7856796.1 hypothetical protein [Lentzea nigeriaca]
MPGDNEKYLADQLDQVYRTVHQGDVDGFLLQVGHVRSESDSQTADTLMRLALDRQVKESRKKIRIWATIAIVMAVGAAITIAVTVPKMLLGTLTDTATTVTQTMVSTVPIPVATPGAPNSSAVPPVPAPDGTNFTVLHELTDFTLGHKGCDDSKQGTLDIDELAPDYRKATITNSDCSGGFGLSYAGKYIALLASPDQPTAQECEKQAKRGSKTDWEIDTVKPDFAFCVVSEAGNVAWLRVVDKDPKGELKLKIIVWKPARR